MRKLAIVILVLGGWALAQDQQEPQVPLTAQVQATNLIEANTTQPSLSDVYCAGFINNQSYDKTKFVAGGWDSPHEMEYSDAEYIYLSGNGYQEGSEYQIIRQLVDMDQSEDFEGQHALLAATGKPYEEIARIRVFSVRKVALAKVEFSCSAIHPGDLVVPWQEETIPTYHATSIQFDQFAPPNGKTTGRIILARDFDYVLGVGEKVYLNVGNDKGVKVGDYFRITRPYNNINRARPDFLSLPNMMDDPNQATPQHLAYKDWDKFPRRSIGEMIILNVTPKSSTGMITYALQDILAGDGVEMEELPPPAAAAPAAPAPMPPTINCTANPASVPAGQSASIDCEASSPDNRPVSVSFTSDRGRVTPRGNSAVLDTADAGQGPINVMATATDDRNLSSNTTTTVNVQPAVNPEANKLTDINFRPSSAYVDNRAKAVLDDVALKLQNDPNARVMISGSAGAKEKGAKRLPGLRAANAKNYLVRDKAVDPNRVIVQTNTSGEHSAEIWFVPQGAPVPGEQPAPPPQQ